MRTIKYRRASVAVCAGLLALAACGEAASDPSDGAAPVQHAAMSPSHIDRPAAGATVHYAPVSPDQIERRAAGATVHYPAVSPDQIERRAVASSSPAWWAQRR